MTGENIMSNTFQVRWVWQISTQWVTYLFNYLNSTVTVECVEFKLTWQMQIICFLPIFYSVLSFRLTLISMERIGQKIVTISIWLADLLRILSNSHNTDSQFIFQRAVLEFAPLLIVWMVVQLKFETTILSSEYAEKRHWQIWPFCNNHMTSLPRQSLQQGMR